MCRQLTKENIKINVVSTNEKLICVILISFLNSVAETVLIEKFSSVQLRFLALLPPQQSPQLPKSLPHVIPSHPFSSNRNVFTKNKPHVFSSQLLLFDWSKCFVQKRKWNTVEWTRVQTVEKGSLVPILFCSTQRRVRH